MVSSPAPPLATIEVTPSNSWALSCERLNWSDQTRTLPELVLVLSTWIVSLMSSRLPWIRFFELEPMASVSAPLLIVPRKDGRLNGTEKVNSLMRGNSKVSVNEVMKRLIST